MNGIWFAAMVAGLVAVGVAAQLGWELRPIPVLKRALDRRRTRADGQPEASGDRGRPVVRPAL